MKWFYVTALIGVVVLSLSPFFFLEDEPRPGAGGDVVAYGTYGAKVKSIDPATCGDTTSAAIQGNVYEGLYGYHYLMRPVEVVPVLAAGMPEVSEDKLTYRIRIRKGVRYHRNPCFAKGPDGIRTREAVAEDFVLAFKRIADYHVKTTLAYAFISQRIEGVQEYNSRTRSYNRGDFSRYDLPITGVRAIDPYTLEIKLTEPFPQLLHVLALHNYAPIPREVIDYHLSTQATEDGREPLATDRRSPEIHEIDAVVGTGAYYLDTWVRGSRIVFRRNPEYRRVTYPTRGTEEDRENGLLDDAGKPVPFTDVRHLTFVPEANPMWMLFLTRQVDVTGIPREMYNDVITPDKTLTDAWKARGIRLITYGNPSVYWYAFNMEDPVLGASKSLRQALNLCFDVEEYIRLIFNGRGIPARAYIPSSFPGYEQALSPYARYDVESAREKITDARRELQAAGVIGPGQDIPPLTLSMPGRDEYFRKMSEFAIRQFKRIGVTVEIELNDWPTLQEKVHNKTAQMYAMGWAADYPDPENFLQLYYSPNIERLTNNTNYSDPRFDALYERASVMQPSPERTALYVEMLRILNEDCPVLLLSEPISFVLVHPWVHNNKPHPFGYGFSKYVRIDARLREQMGGR